MKKLFMKDFQYKLAISELESQITSSKIKYDYIVGLARGGAVPAVYLSHRLKLPVHIMDWSTRDTEYTLGKETNCLIPEDLIAGKRILLVDDIVDTGECIKTLFDDWQTSVREEINFTLIDVCTLFYNEENQYGIKAKYFALPTDPNYWVVFPWEN